MRVVPFVAPAAGPSPVPRVYRFSPTFLVDRVTLLHDVSGEDVLEQNSEFLMKTFMNSSANFYGRKTNSKLIDYQA